MHFTITEYDDHGAPAGPRTVDLPALRTVLAEAATTGRRLHIRPALRRSATAPRRTAVRHPLTSENTPENDWIS
ncbi:hypothetical protein ACFV4F_41075 [Kitasatospora sp. NPDC059722]|uniref:hypothetical protein n=1 Tax=unclassified Kitasatospora TaxID=2633591 RepID=UPI003653F189